MLKFKAPQSSVFDLLTDNGDPTGLGEEMVVSREIGPHRWPPYCEEGDIAVREGVLTIAADPESDGEVVLATEL